MIWTFFIFGSFWFWSLTCLWLIFLTALVEHEETGWSFGSVLIFLALLHLFGNVNLFVYLKENPVGFLQIAAIYVIFGIIWGVSKFYFFNAKIRRKLELLKIEFNKTYKDTGNIEDKQREWDKYWSNNLNWKSKEKLDINNQSSKVIFWISYWPVSAFWTLLNDPLRRFGQFIYGLLFVKIFKTIHKRTVGEALKINK